MTKKGDYLVNMRALFDLLLSHEKDVVEVHKLLGRMFNCIFYRSDLAKAETPESESLARWGIDDADRDLSELMCAWCLSEFEKKVIRDLVKATT